jgi:hypothetical protein
MILSFFIVCIGTIKSYCEFDIIYVDKQPIEAYIKLSYSYIYSFRKLNYVPKPLYSNLISKGGLINYFCESK